jgi:hypothetical protein
MFRFVIILLFLLFFTPTVLAEVFVFTAIPDNDETHLMQRTHSTIVRSISCPIILPLGSYYA